MEEDEKLVSVDIKSLYANVPVEESIEIALKNFDSGAGDSEVNYGELFETSRSENSYKVHKNVGTRNRTVYPRVLHWP